MPMYPPIGDHTHKMRSTTGFYQRFNKRVQRNILFKLTTFYRQINLAKVHCDNPASPNVHVAYFGISHLAGW